jgi:hypothetical protein
MVRLLAMAGEFSQLTDEALRDYLEGAANENGWTLSVEPEDDHWRIEMLEPDPLFERAAALSATASTERAALEALAEEIARQEAAGE